MNFHKTIGFLATLLLTLGLGVPDSYAQDVQSVNLTLSPNSFTDTDDEGNVIAEVGVTLASNAEANMAVTVTLSNITDTTTDPTVPATNPAETADYTLGTLGDVVVSIRAGANSATSTYVVSFDPAADADADNEVVRIQARVGTAATDPTDTADLMITEFISGVTLSVSPNSFTDTDDVTTVTAEVMVTVNDAPSADTPVTVALTNVTDPDGADDDADTTADNMGTAETTDFTFTATDPITVTISAGATSGTGQGTFTFDPAADTDADNEVAVIQAGVTGDGQTDTDNLMITELISMVALTLSPESFEEETTTSVFAEARVTLNAAATAVTAVTVTLTDITDPDGADDDADTTADNIGTAETGDYGTLTLPSIVVNIFPGATSGTGQGLFDFVPAADADNDSEEVVIQAASSGHTYTDMLTISEGEVDEITLSLSADTFVETADAMTVTATVTVMLNSAVGAGTTVTVNVDLSPATVTAEVDDYTIDMLDPIALVFNGDATDGTNQTVTGTETFTFDPNRDAEAEDDETISITAMANGKSSDPATITITDDGMSVGTIMITTDLDEIRENVRARDVVVTARLSETSTEDVTVAINAVVEGDSDEPTAAVMDNIVIKAGSTEGSVTISLDPSDDDIFTTRNIKVTGSAPEAGYISGSAMIEVLDDDSAIGALTITAASPPSVTTGTATDVTLTVKGLIFDKEEDSGTVTATVKSTAGTFQNTSNTNNVKVTVASDGKSAQVRIDMVDNPDLVPDEDSPDGNTKVLLSLSADDAATAGTRITVTASADMYDAGSRVVTIANRGGLDIQGYRAVLSKPAANGWAIDSNNQVFVDVKRVGSVAYPWSQFERIKVSVRDTAHDNTATPYEIATVIAENFNLEDNGAVTFDESGDRGDVKWQGNDTIRFQIQIHRHDANDPAGNGQYLGAYAHVEFISGSTRESLTNRDSDKPVYPSNPTLVDEANRYRGDGKLFKVDNLPPSNSAITAVNVSSGDEIATNNAGTNDLTATVDDEIRVAVKVSGNVLFRDSGIRIMVRPVDGTGSYKGITYPASKVAPKNKNIVFTANQVIAAANDSLRHTFTVTEGFFTFGTDDYIEGIGPKGTIFQPDEASGEVLVQVKDQAGNYSGAAFKKQFDIDSRSPGVRIRYPAADPDSIYDHTDPLRFTGDVADDQYGYNEYLNPLVIEVDEDLSKLQVFAVGADTLDISEQFSTSSVGDSTITYDTSQLASPKKDGEGDDDKYPDKAYVPSYANIAGTEIELAVLATDALGNTTKATISGVTHDAARPELKEWFPKTSLLEDGQFNDATPPVFTLPEDVDSIAVRFTAPGRNDVTKKRGGMTTKGEDSIDFSGALTDDVLYEMTIFVRDLAGNVYITPADSSSNMRFNAEFDNPEATRYKISAGMDSVIAGQANMLTIQAEDHDAESDTQRNALTYKNAARISAWDADGGAAESVWFEGTGVDDDADSPDGVAMLSVADWRIGKRDVTVKSNKATGLIKIMVQHLDSGMGDTAVVGFDSAIDSLYVGAADFAGFEITAEKDGEVFKDREEVQGVNVGDKFILRVVPVDRHNNPSVRAFKPAEDGSIDSLSILDTRVKDSGAYEYKEGFDITVRSSPEMKGLPPFEWTLDPEGWPFTVEVPGDQVVVQVRIDNTTVHSDDMRSQNTRDNASFTFAAPLTPEIAASETGDVTIPVDGEAMVTVTASGYNAGSMVTFTKTKNGTAMDPVTKAADDDGNATLDITMAEAGTVTVSATDGRYSTDTLTITFTDTPAEPMRMAYADADGNPVYLISDTDMTVGVDDFLAFVAAYGSSDGDDNYNLQADVDDDGDVDIDDFLTFITSYNRTAVGPATKPIVLLPGINENAEFSLSLGSERVVAGELVAVDVSLANVAALVGYGFALNYESDKFEFVSVAPADEDLLKSTGGETLFHHIVSDGQITVANGLYNGTAVSGGGGVVQFVFRVLREFEDNARFEIADGLVFDPSQLQNPAVVAGVLELQSTPREFALHQNFPNPFNPDTTIKYDLAESADVTLQIYNVLGQVVRTLVASEAQNAGRYQIRWNGMDDRGVPVSSGIYFYQISADGKFSDVRKLMLLK